MPLGASAAKTRAPRPSKLTLCFNISQIGNSTIVFVPKK
jgi:hypothetical protein